MKKQTKSGEWEPMKPREEAAVLIFLAITSALCGVGLYKLYQLIF